MRVLFTSIPQTGHVTPLLPLARALAADGDEVVFASGIDAQEAVTSADLVFRCVGPPFSEWFERLTSRARGVPGDGLPPERVESYFLPRLFGEVGLMLMLDDLVSACEDFRPGAVVFDPVMYAAPLAAAVSNAVPVLHTVGPITDAAVLQLVQDAVSPAWSEFGLWAPSAAGVYSGLTLAICPPSIDPASVSLERVLPLRPTELPAAPTRSPATFPDTTRPIVYLTMGTFSNSNVDLFRHVVDVLALEPVNLLVTIGRDNDPADFRPQPANVHIEQFVPQAEVLPHCSAVVHHAGAGTSFAVLAHGLPSVVLPQSADNFTIAGRLSAAGAARKLMPGEMSAEALRSALQEVLEQSVYREAARRLADEIRAMPSVQSVAPQLRDAIKQLGTAANERASRHP